MAGCGYGQLVTDIRVYDEKQQMAKNLATQPAMITDGPKILFRSYCFLPILHTLI